MGQFLSVCPLLFNGLFMFYFKLFLFFFCLSAISWATPSAYGGSQARGCIGAVASGLHQSHSNLGSEPHLQPTPQLVSWQCQILNPLSKVRDRTCNLMVPSWIRFCCHHGNSQVCFLYFFFSYALHLLLSHGFWSAFSFSTWLSVEDLRV